MTKFCLTEEEDTKPKTKDRALVLKNWLKEIDNYYEQMHGFGTEEPDDIFRCLSSWTARASYMRSQINRSESKMLQAFRAKQIDPFISECDRQFRIWSRVFTVVTLDYNLARGQT